MREHRDSVTATSLSQLGGCELRVVHDLGYTDLKNSHVHQVSEQARKRGIHLHSESERVVERVFKEESRSRWGIVRYGLLALVIGIACAFFRAMT